MWLGQFLKFITVSAGLKNRNIEEFKNNIFLHIYMTTNYTECVIISGDSKLFSHFDKLALITLRFLFHEKFYKLFKIHHILKIG